MKKKMKCWEVFKCEEKECPAYQSKDLKCWLFSVTHCRKEIQGKFLEKMEMCLRCEVFKANMDVSAMKDTVDVIDKQFKEFTSMVEERDRELEDISMELALSLSETLEALNKIASGDPTVRIPEESENELIAKLKQTVNKTAREIGTIVDQSHEFAIGLAEHFDILHRVSKGDLNARIPEISQDELLKVLGNVTNQMIESVSKEITEHKQAEEQIKRQLDRISALRTIDLAITASLDLRVTFNIFLDQVTTQLKVDAADILLFDPNIQKLEFVAGRGFKTSALKCTRLSLGEGNAGCAASERRIIHISNLKDTKDSFRRSPLLDEEGFVAYYGTPLIAKGQIKGVLEIFHRTPLEPDSDWLDFLESLARQATVAIDNASLFDSLQRSNIELLQSYDTTLEGWSRALDLRDKETEGHSVRVTEITLRIARALGMVNSDLIHIRRGALLHDIGKMGISDRILLKPGPLTDEEREIMQEHPVYSYELLSPIAYLRPAIDIPYCHHEKWDGTGYPRRLKGEQIPLAARIFAVVDVWDALLSDRPYRPAWSKEKTIKYIREEAEKSFDQKVVEVFLKEIGETTTVPS